LFATTDTFLERLGLDSLEQLPSLGDFVPDASLVETLERGLRLPGEPTSTEDTDADADASEDAETVLTDVVVEKFDFTEVNAIAAELQEGLDDD
jgi:segregation and condensation protein B